MLWKEFLFGVLCGRVRLRACGGVGGGRWTVKVWIVRMLLQVAWVGVAMECPAVTMLVRGD